MNSRFQAGGTLAAGKVYVTRAADEDLKQRLLEGHYCYVLAPRQIGKSSLQVRTADRLRVQGIRCVNIDLTSIGSTEVSAEAFYASLCKATARQLQLGDTEDFWQANASLTPAARWSSYLQDHVLVPEAGRIVIFIDEVDSIRSTPWRDEFFAAIRALYNLRSTCPVFENLSFCLIGATLPSDLIQDLTRTPFNIGRSINILDFTRAQMDAFTAELARAEGDTSALLDAIFDWTAGHPYMTQRICEALVELGPQSGPEAERVEALVHELFLSPRPLEKSLEATERHFRDARIVKKLALYRRIRDGEHVVSQAQDPTQMALRMIGIVAEREQDGVFCLKVRNRIYAHTFDEAWIRDIEAERLIARPLNRWAESGRRDEDVLRGQALQDALDWARHKKLSAEEAQFLAAGREAERRDRSQQQNTLFFTETMKSFGGYLVTGMLGRYLQDQFGFSKDRAHFYQTTLWLLFFLTPVLGGFLGDVRLGHRRSVVFGLWSLILGYFLLAAGQTDALYCGLLALVVGNTFYKSNFLALVGSVHPKGAAEQDTAFLIYYVSLNLGGALGRSLASAFQAVHPTYFAVAGGALLISLFGFLRHPPGERYFRPDAPPLVSMEGRWNTRRRICAVLSLSLIAVLFWLAFDQIANVLSAWLGQYKGTGFHLLSTAPFPIVMADLLSILLTPVVWGLFRALRRRGKEPTTLAKLQVGMGLTGLTILFLLLADANRVRHLWLIVGHCLMTLADLCLIPLGFALVVKLAPKRYVSTMIGIWYAALAIGNNLSDRVYSIGKPWSHINFFLALVCLTALSFWLLHRFARYVIKGRFEEFRDVPRSPYLSGNRRP